MVWSIIQDSKMENVYNATKMLELPMLYCCGGAWGWRNAED